jgi:hypothetical protein
MMPFGSRPFSGDGSPAPCRNCADRVPPTEETKGCHSTCEKYLAFCKVRDEAREVRHAKTELLNYVIDKSIKAKVKSAKKKRKWGNLD